MLSKPKSRLKTKKTDERDLQLAEAAECKSDSRGAEYLQRLMPVIVNPTMCGLTILFQYFIFLGVQ